MHYYIVDAQKLTQRQYERVQNELYSSLSTFKVTGEIVRITAARTIPQLLEAALSRQATTIVAVGVEETFNDLINAAFGKDIVLGFIPAFDCELGRMLGINSIEQGARAIAGRRIAGLDLGKINGYYFFTKLSFGLLKQATGFIGSIKNIFNLPTFNINFSAVGKFQATANAIGGMIINSRDNDGSGSKIGDPVDGRLDILLLPKLTKLQILKYRNKISSGLYESIPGSSLVHADMLEITSPAGLPLIAGDKVLAKTPATIEIIPEAIRMIVGRDRSF